METNNLLVEAFFILSVPANQDGEDRLARLFGNALSGRPVGMPGRHVVAGLSQPEGHATHQSREEQAAPRFHKVNPDNRRSA
jgi:hypothetical protein